MRKTMYSFGIAAFLAMLIFTVATSLSNPFYGMSEAALAQTSSHCTSSGGGGTTSACPSGCRGSCASWTEIEFDPIIGYPEYSGLDQVHESSVCCSYKVCVNGQLHEEDFIHGVTYCKYSKVYTYQTCDACTTYNIIP